MRVNRKKMIRNRIIVILALLLVVLLVVLIIKSCSSSSNHVSSETKDSIITKETEIIESHNDSNIVETEESEETETIIKETEIVVPISSQTYEEKVGKNYIIDISKYLEFIDPSEDYLTLVNLNNPLPSGYVPQDLVDSLYSRKDRTTQQISYIAEMALEAMMEEASQYGITGVTITSGYRSESLQSSFFNKYINNEMSANPSLTYEEAEQIVLTYSMRPGCSEHQLGLGFDMHNLSAASTDFGSTTEGIWLAENCYRFGFVIRYPQDKTEVTGVQWEPWHFRFVGRKSATEMHDLNMCLEEYVAYKNK